MTGKEVIKDIMRNRNLTQYELADIMGKNQSNITGYLNRGKTEMRLDIFTELAEAMDCEVVVRDKTDSDNQWTVKF